MKKLEGKLTIDHFQLVSRLGSGDVGTVNLMVLKGSNLKFAVKSLNKQEMLDRNKTNRIRTEDTILSTVDHPFLATLYTCFQSEKHLYFVMEARARQRVIAPSQRRAQAPAGMSCASGRSGALLTDYSSARLLIRPCSTAPGASSTTFFYGSPTSDSRRSTQSSTLRRRAA